MKNRIAICGSVGLPAKYGGWETLVEQVSGRFCASGYRVIVYCSKLAYQAHPKSIGCIDLQYIPLRANGIQSILYDLVSVVHAMFVQRAQIILVLGVSVGIFAPLLKLINIFGSQLVINVDGIEWQRRKWGNLTRLFLKLSERLSVRYFHNVVSDNQIIYDYIRQEYGVCSHVITYGADHTSRESPNSTILSRYPFLASPFFLTICRIVPENNINLICEAAVKTGFKTVIIGNWDSSEYGKLTRNKYAPFRNLELLDQNYDLFDLNVLRSHCAAYIHGHECGGTNPSLVEAMAFGCPLFCFDVGFNRVTTANLARYFDNVPSLSALMRSYRKFSSDGRALMILCDEQYKWDKVAELYRELFLSHVNKKSEHDSKKKN